MPLHRVFDLSAQGLLVLGFLTMFVSWVRYVPVWERHFVNSLPFFDRERYLPIWSRTYRARFQNGGYGIHLTGAALAFIGVTAHLIFLVL